MEPADYIGIVDEQVRFADVATAFYEVQGRFCRGDAIGAFIQVVVPDLQERVFIEKFVETLFFLSADNGDIIDSVLQECVKERIDDAGAFYLYERFRRLKRDRHHPGTESRRQYYGSFCFVSHILFIPQLYTSSITGTGTSFSSASSFIHLNPKGKSSVK